MSDNANAVLTRIQTAMTFVLFVGVELLIVVVFRKNRDLLNRDNIINVYTICFLASMPALAGVQGIRVVNRLSSRSDITDSTKRKLNNSFLTGIGFAYAALGCITAILAGLTRR